MAAGPTQQTRAPTNSIVPTLAFGPAAGRPSRGAARSATKAAPPETLQQSTPARVTPAGEAAAKAVESPDDPLIGQTPLGQYRILKRIGSGGFGSVYLAEQIGVGRKAIIKILHSSLAGSEPFVKRFQREAAVLAALDHPHLVHLYNFGELDDGQLFLAMEYGGDRTLADEIRLEGRLDPERALQITEQVCSALHEAHTHGIVHRDLKPPNILLGRKEGHDWVKVVDVGIAKILDSADLDEKQSQLTAAGAILGTPAYFSPEQARGLPLDARSDIYAMGCVLYEMLSGKLPVEAKSPIDFVRAHCVEPPVPLKKRGVKVPRPVEEILERALEKDPARRFQTTLEMEKHAMQAREQIAAGRAPRRWRPVATLAFAALGAAAVAVAGVYIFRRPPPPPAVERIPPPEPAPAPAAQPVEPAPQPEPVPPKRAEPAAEKPERAPPPRRPKADLRAGQRQTARTEIPPDWAAKLSHASELDRHGDYQEAIKELEGMLSAPPPAEAIGAVYRGLGEAHYHNGESVEALRYFELYRPYCPRAQAKQLAKTIEGLREELGLSRRK